MKTILKIGDQAPEFKGTDQEGKVHSLVDYRGKYLLLYFYPKDNTPGCTIEACTIRDYYEELKKQIQILGVSSDSQKSHQGFAEKYALPFSLIADTEKKIIKSYGADGLVFPKRTSFLIGPDGVVLKVYEKVIPSEHAGQILADLKDLVH